MRQRLAHELLDDDEGTPAEISRSLEELWWINQHLGGCSTWRQLLRHVGSAATLLDVGAGSGQMAAFLASLLGARAVAVDRRASHLGPGGLRLAANAFRLPFPDASFDLVTCNLFLHHFHGGQARRLLQEMARVARRAVLINDLERAWPPWLAIVLLGLRFSRLTRHDGPRSVRQAYTAAELRELAGARPHQLLRLWPYRLGLILWREPPVQP